MIIAAVASGGTAMIANLFLALLAAARLAQKIRNLTVLEEIGKKLQKSKPRTDLASTACKNCVLLLKTIIATYFLLSKLFDERLEWIGALTLWYYYHSILMI